MMPKYKCQGCRLETRRLKSRCLMQLQINQWNGMCINCCCLNSIRRRPCDDPTGLGFTRETHR
jgi:hypothetical protein